LQCPFKCQWTTILAATEKEEANPNEITQIKNVLTIFHSNEETVYGTTQQQKA